MFKANNSMQRTALRAAADAERWKGEGKMMFIRLVRQVVRVAMLVSLAACASTGRNFNEGRITLLRPGETTLNGAIEILDAKPTSHVYQDDGSTIAIWQYVSVVYVTTTENNLVSILFDERGVMERIVTLVNVDLPEAERKRLRVMSASTVEIR